MTTTICGEISKGATFIPEESAAPEQIAKTAAARLAEVIMTSQNPDTVTASDLLAKSARGGRARLSTAKRSDSTQLTPSPQRDGLMRTIKRGLKMRSLSVSFSKNSSRPPPSEQALPIPFHKIKEISALMKSIEQSYGDVVQVYALSEVPQTPVEPPQPVTAQVNRANKGAAQSISLGLRGTSVLQDLGRWKAKLIFDELRETPLFPVDETTNRLIWSIGNKQEVDHLATFRALHEQALDLTKVFIERLIKHLAFVANPLRENECTALHMATLFASVLFEKPSAHLRISVQEAFARNLQPVAILEAAILEELRDPTWLSRTGIPGAKKGDSSLDTEAVLESFRMG